jgi:L-threonylcarbamoyladenylate synthase
VRVPNHPVTSELLSKLDFPLAAPSANPFNRISPTKANHVETYFKNEIKMVLDGGSCKNGIESTIIGFENGEPIIYRLGALAIEDIENVVGKVSLKNKKEQNPEAPGMLAKHYAPKTKTILVDDVKAELKNHPNKKVGVLFFSESIIDSPVDEIILSSNRNYKEAASNLYGAMHQLDQMDLDVIIAERFPNVDLGKSINDRLQRATS